MIPVQFDYKTPENVTDAAKLLHSHEGAMVLAGSHSLIEALKQGNVSPSLLIDLKNISALRGIQHDANGVRLGGMTSYGQVANTPEIQQNYPILAEIANSIGDAQIRNWERIGDTFAYRNLACGILALALVWEARFEIVDVTGSCTIGAEDLIKLASDRQWLQTDIICAIAFPSLNPKTGTSYQFLKNPASYHPICAIAAWVEPAADGNYINQCRVAVAGASSYPIRLRKVEDAMKGKAPTQENIATAAKLASDKIIAEKSGLTIVSDLYASAEYRTHLISVLTKRALIQAIQRAEFSI